MSEKNYSNSFKSIDYYASKYNLTYKNKFNSEYCEHLIDKENIKPVFLRMDSELADKKK